MPSEAGGALNVAVTLGILLTMIAFPSMIVGARVRVVGIAAMYVQAAID